MSKYSKVKDYYDCGLWSFERVKNAVIKQWITADEFEEITGEIYGANTGIQQCGE